MTKTSGGERVVPVTSNGHAGGRNLDARIRIVERFEGPRLRHEAIFWRRLRSAMLLIVIGLVLAGTVASVLGAGIWGLSVAIHHASTG